MMWKKMTPIVVCVGFFTGCTAVKLESGAQQVRIVTNEPQRVRIPRGGDR